MKADYSSRVLSGGAICFLYFTTLLFSTQAQEDNPLDQQRSWVDDRTAPVLEDKRRLKGLQFGRRALDRLQFGKRLEPEDSEGIPEIAEDGVAEDLDKRYYTDMLDNLYLEDLLQNLNVDRWRKRARMTFGKRAPDSWPGKRMRLTFGKRDGEYDDEDYLRSLEDEKRARLTFGKRNAEQ